ncbi:MAG: hypothetical protein H6867_04045 [Rhodospirillales bacterium]|nr:hypothetical protein [Rhodospirillales bacterium]MCB9996322.1 hypothetical protein [Rhodospirillales bacterium]
MRNLNNDDGAGNGGGGSDTSAPGKAAPKPPTAAQVADWWDDFAKAVEDPTVSTYDYLKDSLLKNLELDGADGFGDFVGKAQQKALKELLSLTDLGELRNTVKKLERNRLFFDYRTRVGLQVTRVLLDTYLSAKEKYEQEVTEREAHGKPAHTERQKQAEIERIVKAELQDSDIAERVEELAQISIPGKDKEQISETVTEARKQLQDKRNLKKISNDVMGVSKKYFTLDNTVNVAIHALPLITWQYRWALAAVFGAYVSRMSVYHGYRAIKARWQGDLDTAREEGRKTLKALKAAGGNALAIGVSPLIGRLPKAIAGFGTFFVTRAYNISLDVWHKMLQKKDELKARAAAQAGKKGVWNKIKGFFTEHQDTLAVLTAKAVKGKMPHDLGDSFEKASSRLPLSRVRSLSGNLWNVSKAAGRRLRYEFYRVTNVFRDEPKDLSQMQAAFDKASKGKQNEGADTPSDKVANDNLSESADNVPQDRHMNGPQ